MKKIFRWGSKVASVWMAFVLLFLLSCFPSSVQAAEVNIPTITVGSMSALSGDTVNVPVSIADNPGIIGAKLTITFGNELTLISAKTGDAFSALQMTKPGAFTSPCNFTWDAMEIAAEDIKDGTILTLTFKVADSVTDGTELPVTITYNEKGGIVIPDGQSLKSISANIVSGKVKVQSKSTAAAAEFTSAFLYDGTAFFNINAASDIGSASLILAAYTSSGRMCGIVTHTIQLSEGSNDYEFACNLSGDLYKVFLLSSSYAPLCAAKEASVAAAVYAVTFVDWDGTVLSEQKVCAGESADPPADPERSGYQFTGWSRGYLNISSNCTITAQYKEDTTPTFTVSSVTAKPGDKSITVTISISNNPGILGMTLKLTYDDSVLTLKSAKNGAAVSDVLTLTKPKTYVNGCSFIWDGVEVGESDIQDGTILTLTFDIADDAAADDYPIGISFNKVVDNDLKAITYKVINGIVAVDD